MLGNEQEEESKKEDLEILKVEAAFKLKEALDFSGAVSCYTKVIALSKENTRYVFFNNRALAYLGAGDFNNAIRDCDSSLAMKENPKAYSRKASALGDKQQYNTALECVLNALALAPHDREALNVKAELENVLALQYSIQAAALGDQQQYADALECLSKALTLLPEHKESLRVKAVLEEASQAHQLRERDRAEAEEYRKEGTEKFQNNFDFKSAVCSYTKAIALVKSNTVYYNNRALAYLLEGEYEKAIADCDSSLDIKENPKAYCRKASARVELGQLSEALTDIEKALNLSPDDKEALNIKVGLLEAKAQHDKKQQEAEKYRVEGTKKINTQFDFQGAVFSYTKAIALVKSNTIYYNNRALAYLLAHEYEKTISDCNASLEIKENPKAYCRRASAFGELGKLPQALIDIEQALRLSPHDKEALNIKIGLLEAKAQHDERIRRHEIDIILQEMKVKVETISDLNTSALEYFRAGDFENTITDCSASLTIKANHAAYSQKAAAHGECGQLTEALEDIKTALHLAPSDPEALQVEVKIKALLAEELQRIAEENRRQEDERKRLEKEKRIREEERKRLYEEQLRWEEQRRVEQAQEVERQRLRALKAEHLRRQLAEYYQNAQRLTDAEYIRFAKSAAFVSACVDFAKEVVVIYFETDIQRLLRVEREEKNLARNQFRSRGLRRLDRAEEELIKAQVYSRKRRAKKPDHFIQSDYFSLNLFNELKFFTKTINDVDVNTLDSRLEVIANSRKESNVALNKIVNDISTKLFDQLSQNWGHLRYTLQYTEDEELTLVFDARDLYVNGKLSDNDLSRYMTNMAVTGVAAKAKLRPRSDRWRKLEYLCSDGDDGGCGSGSDLRPQTSNTEDDIPTFKKTNLVFSFFIPLYNSRNTTIHGNRTMQQEIDAFKKTQIVVQQRNNDSSYRNRSHKNTNKETSRVVKNQNKNPQKVTITNGTKKNTTGDLPPVRVTRRNVGHQQLSRQPQEPPAPPFPPGQHAQTGTGSHTDTHTGTLLPSTSQRSSTTAPSRSVPKTVISTATSQQQQQQQSKFKSSASLPLPLQKAKPTSTTAAAASKKKQSKKKI